MNHNLKYIICLKNCLPTYFRELLSAFFYCVDAFQKYELQRAPTLSEKQWPLASFILKIYIYFLEGVFF